MQVVQTENTYRIYASPICVSNLLDAKVYEIGFNDKQGFFLMDADPIRVNEKVYGIHEAKVEKVFNSFKLFERNLGVILSGAKGIGKSLFAKLLSKRAIENGYPLIIVNSFIPGIGEFINSIKQECMVLFDEFDKTFCTDRQKDQQASLLTLFDGLAQGKKLFVITCNSLTGLNEFLLNRPGRFHYHFRFEFPNSDEITEYMRDKLSSAFWNEIPKVVSFANKVPLNYDCLRAISFELSLGTAFEEAIKDLNILRLGAGELYNITVHFKDGTYSEPSRERIDLFSGESKECSFTFDHKDFCVRFNTSNIQYNIDLGMNILVANDIEKIQYLERYIRRNDAEEELNELEHKEIKYISFKRALDPSVNYNL